jgi:hypothetical protein
MRKAFEIWQLINGVVSMHSDHDRHGDALAALRELKVPAVCYGEGRMHAGASGHTDGPAMRAINTYVCGAPEQQRGARFGRLRVEQSCAMGCNAKAQMSTARLAPELRALCRGCREYAGSMLGKGHDIDDVMSRLRQKRAGVVRTAGRPVKATNAA